MLVTSQHGDSPARRRIVNTDLAIQADDEPPTIRREDRGGIPHGPSEDGDEPARGGPQTTGLPTRGESVIQAAPSKP